MCFHCGDLGVSYLQHMDGRPREAGDARGDSEGDPGEESVEAGSRVRQHTTQWTQRTTGK